MKQSAQKNLRGTALLLAAFLLAAGCADLVQGPPESPEGGWVAISIAVPARTVAPRIDQFSKIEITFERRGGSGTLSPVAVTGGAALIYLPPGTWELTASAYNSADPPTLVARAVNTLTRAGNEVSGNASFVLGPVGTGNGTLSYAIALPQGLTIETGRIAVERAGVVAKEQALDGESNGVFSLAGGRYVVDILLDNGEGEIAVFREAAVILPGLLTAINFAPAAEDFLDPAVRAALTAAPVFRLTEANSSGAKLEESGGGETSRTQRLSASFGKAAVYFALEKTAGQTVTVSGSDAAKVSMGAADGESPGDTLAVFAVNTADLIYGGDRVFALALEEPHKETVAVAVTVTIGYIKTLTTTTPPYKNVYIQGENFDPAGMVLEGTYSDGRLLSTLDKNIATVAGFDSSSVGEQTLWASIRGRLSSNSITVKVLPSSDRRIFFDYGIRHSDEDVQPNRYSVPLGRTLVLAPVKWHIPDTAVYEWKVDGATQASSTEYLSLTPAAQRNYAVTVTAKIGTASYTASTTVECVAPAGTYKRSSSGEIKATKIDHKPAPGQHTGNVELFTGFTCCGAWGGYIVYKFDHSVERGSGKELGIGGNAFGGWSEPGVVWVMQDENGNGEPDDTWYELAGSHTLRSDTKRRYAVTYTKGAGWIDNSGSMGVPGRYINGYPSGAPSPMTFVGTGLPGHYGDDFSGYVDAACEQRYSIGNAIQVNGDPVNLGYIDFVKVQTSLNIWAYQFGEISTEVYHPPQDMSVPDPNRLLAGVDAGGGQYSYQFVNNSGYDLTVTLGTEPEFILNRNQTVTKTLTLSQAYFDYYGGNADFVRAPGKVTFADRPE